MQTDKQYPNEHITYLKDIYTYLHNAERSLRDLKTHYVKVQVYDKAREIHDIENSIGHIKDKIDSLMEYVDPVKD